jgi:acyl dehydratase
LGFDLSRIGKTLESVEFRVNTARLGQFAAATNDENPRHLEGAIAPPVFANVPPMQQTVESLLQVTKDFALHGEHDFHLHRPIMPGMRLRSRATLHGVHPSPAGVSVVIKTETAEIGGKVVDEQYFTALVAGAKLGKGAGETAPGHRLPDDARQQPPVAKVTYPMATDQTRRYADASRDYSEYALNPEAARAKGLEGVLVHGMLTMAFAGRVVVDKVCGGDTARLKRLGGRFSAPVYLLPDQKITTTIWSLGRRDGREVFGFEAAEAGGRTAIRHGIAEVAA